MREFRPNRTLRPRGLAPHLAVAIALAFGLSVACASDAGPTAPPTLSADATSAGTVAPSPHDSLLPPPPSAMPSATVAPAPAALVWTAMPLPVDPSFTTAGVIDVAVLDGLFLAVGAGWQEDERGVHVNVPLFWLSRDGSAWELVVDDAWAAGYIDALTTWRGQFLAAGYVGDERASAAFWTSADGRAWERLRDQPVLEFFRGATEGRDIVAGGIAELRSDGAELVARGWLYCACERGVRDATVEWRTRDGEQWQRKELPAGDDGSTPIAAGGDFLRIAPDRGSIDWSSDGVTWRTAWAPAPTGDGQAPAGVQLFRLGVAAGGFLAVGASLADDSTRPLAVSSADGAAWGVSSGDSIEGLEGALIAFAASGDGPVVAVGRAGDPAQPFVWLAIPRSTLQDGDA